MKVSSVIKLILLFLAFYYVVLFIQANSEEASTVLFPYIPDALSVSAPVWAIIGVALAVGFLGSALWMLVKTIVSFFSPTGRLNRSMKKVEEKYYYGIEALSKGDQEAAGVFFEEILAIDPQNFRTLVKYGELLRRNGNSQRAISLHLQALDLSQNNVKVLHELSLDYMAAGNTLKAREMLEQIIEISPKGNVTIHRELRDLFIEEKSWDQALAVQRRIMGLIKSQAEQKRERNYLSGLEYETAMVKKDEGKISTATEILSEIIKRDDTFLPAHLELGECLVLQGEEDDAIEVWMQAFELTESPVLLNRLESYFLENDQPERAIEAYNAVIIENQERLLPRFLLGKLYYRLEMLDRAMEIFEEIGNEFDYAPALHYFRGKIQARKGNHKEAAENFRHIIRTSALLEAEYVCTVSGATFPEYVPYSPQAGMWNTVRLNVEKGKSLAGVASRPIYV